MIWRWILLILVLVILFFLLRRNTKDMYQTSANACGYVLSYIDMSSITNDQINQLLLGQPVVIPNGWRMYTSNYMNLTIQLTNFDPQTLAYTGLNIQYKESPNIQLPLTLFTSSTFLVRLNAISRTASVTFDQTATIRSYCFSNIETITLLQPQFDAFLDKLNGFSFDIDVYNCNIDLSSFSDFYNMLVYTQGSTPSPIGTVNGETCNVSVGMTDPTNPSVNYTNVVTNSGNVPYQDITTWNDLYFTVNLNTPSYNLGEYVLSLSTFVSAPITITLTKTVNDHSKDANPPARIFWDLITYNMNVSSAPTPYATVDTGSIIVFNLVNLSVFVEKFNNINYGAFLNRIPLIDECNSCYSCYIAGSLVCDGSCKDINSACENTATYIIPNIISCDMINTWPVCPGGSASDQDLFCDVPLPSCVENCIDGEDEEEYAGCMVGCGLGTLLISRCANK